MQASSSLLTRPRPLGGGAYRTWPIPRRRGGGLVHVHLPTSRPGLPPQPAVSRFGFLSLPPRRGARVRWAYYNSSGSGASSRRPTTQRHSLRPGLTDWLLACGRRRVAVADRVWRPQPCIRTGGMPT